MKKRLKNLLRVFAILLFMSGFAVSTRGGTITPPPPPNSSSNTGSNKLGGSAPIGGGLFILMGLGIAYGGRKIYDLRRSKKKEEEAV